MSFKQRVVGSIPTALTKKLQLNQILRVAGRLTGAG
jgi:hypothetical protein